MTWKRCDGCTRAIASAAFTCEYCGHACGDPLDDLKLDESEQPGFAWPPENVAPDRWMDGAPPLSHVELNSVLPFPSELVETPPSLNRSTSSLDSFPADDESAFAPAWSAPSAAGDAARLRPCGATARPEPQAVASPRQTTKGTRRLVMVGAALFAPALIFTILSMRGSASPTAAETAVPPAAHHP